MKILHLLSISIVFVVIIILFTHFNVLAACEIINGTQDCVGLPPILTSIKSDHLVYENSDKPVITITGVPYSMAHLEIDNQLGDMEFSHSVEVMPTGVVNYTLDISSYKSGLYTAIASTPANKLSANFRISRIPLLGPIIAFNTMNITYVPGDSITTHGACAPNRTIQLSLIDPNGNVVNSIQVNSDSSGEFSSDNLRIPTDAISGTWEINATRGTIQGIQKIKVNSPNTITATIESTLEQFKSGVPVEDIVCKEGFHLIVKAEDGSPACVKPDTAQKLIERGWAILPSAYHGPAWKSFVARIPTYGNITNGTAQPLIPPPMAPLLPSHHFNYTAGLYAKIPNWNQRFVCYKYQGYAIQISAYISNALKFSGLVTGPNGVVHDIPSAALNSTLMQIQFSASSSDPDGTYSVAFNVVNGSNTSNVNFYCAGTEMTEPMMHPPLHATPP